ncbi:MAG: hypothetical protein H0V09_01900 [Gemmatimonadetes bacterium]|nr:hypothetical protein [Gemmatimonadota bacterium]
MISLVRSRFTLTALSLVRSRFALTVPLALLGLLPFPLAAQDYEFTQISVRRSFDPFGLGTPSINARGEVAFTGFLISGVTGIFRGAGGDVTLIADDSGRISFLGVNPSINDLGDVSFAAGLERGGEGIFRGNGGPLTTIATTEPGRFNFFGFDTSLNNQGVVAFKAELDSFDEGLFAGDGSGVVPIYRASTSRFTGEDSGPSLNDAGPASGSPGSLAQVKVAFSERTDAGRTGNFLFRSGDFTTIALASDAGRIGFVEIPSLNDAGQVAFHAFLNNAPHEAILVGDGRSLSTIATTVARFRSFRNPSLNDEGAVAFFAELDTGEQGIFLRNDSASPIIRVIGTGDRLDGSTVTSLSFAREGLNDEGQLAFLVQLGDDRTAIFRATPLP